MKQRILSLSALLLIAGASFAQNVGVNNTSPAAALHVVSNSTTDNQFIVQRSDLKPNGFGFFIGSDGNVNLLSGGAGDGKAKIIVQNKANGPADFIMQTNGYGWLFENKGNTGPNYGDLNLSLGSTLYTNYGSGGNHIGFFANSDNNHSIYVNGDVYATAGFFTPAHSYPDYVFEKYYTGKSALKEDYKMMSLDEVAAYTKEHNHLPGITAVSDLKKTKDGGYEVNISNLATQSLVKIEELYLHVIEQNKQIEALTDKVNQLEHNKKARKGFLFFGRK